MDSQITLVNPAKSTTYTFTPNSMISASITASQSPGKPLYTLTTNSTDSSVIKDARPGSGGAVVAKIARHLMLPDAVAFVGPDGGKPKEIRVGKWMKEAKLGGNSGYIIETGEGFRVFFRRHVEHRLALFLDSDLDTPLAFFRLPNPEHPLSAVSIVIDGRVPEEFHIQVLLAFMYEEHRMRQHEKWTLTAEARTTATNGRWGYATAGSGQYMS
ncbi:hypothetical protein HMN09_00810800 [Mycena chlorophos]|uniref:Uncharacterized protein n=1 Tax=Mycena chlorophos TaxID=658473 RepID=A0A8H6SVS0_MYCCL|nr:hypothetical protein HMN09_00810800 [Mycena chlorophos]